MLTKILLIAAAVGCAMIPVHNTMRSRMHPDLDEDLIRASIYVRVQLEGGVWSAPELVQSVIVENPVGGQDVLFDVEMFTYVPNVRHQFAVQLEDGWMDDGVFRPVNPSAFSEWSLSYGDDTIAPQTPGRPEEE